MKQDIGEKNEESCYITWRSHLGRDSRLLNNFSYDFFYDGLYIGKTGHGLTGILKKISNFNGKVVFIEVPYAKNFNEVTLNYPKSRGIPFFTHKADAIKFIDALKNVQVELKFNYNKVNWDYKNSNSSRTFKEDKNKKSTQEPHLNSVCKISWIKRENHSRDYFFNSKNVGKNEIGLNKILTKLKDFKGNTLYIELPNSKGKTNQNLVSDDYFSIPFFCNFIENIDLNNPGVVNIDINDPDAFISLIKSKNLTVKLKFQKE